MSFFEDLHATLDSQLIKYFAQKAPAGRLSGKKYDFLIKNRKNGIQKGVQKSTPKKYQKFKRSAPPPTHLWFVFLFR